MQRIVSELRLRVLFIGTVCLLRATCCDKTEGIKRVTRSPTHKKSFAPNHWMLFHISHERRKGISVYVIRGSIGLTYDDHDSDSLVRIDRSCLFFSFISTAVAGWDSLSFEGTLSSLTVDVPLVLSSWTADVSSAL